MTMSTAKRRFGRPLLAAGVLAVLGLTVGTLAVAAAGGGLEAPRAARPGLAPDPVPEAAAAPLPEAGMQRPERRGGRRFDVRDRWRGSRDRGWGFRGAIAGLPAFGPRLARELELTDEQRDQIRDTMRAVRDERTDARRQLADTRRALMEAARDPETTDARLRELGEAVGRNQADQIVAWRAGRGRILAILTDEQRARLNELRESRGERRGGRRG